MVVPARSGDASEYVFQLRDGGAPIARTDTFDEWLCRSCALRWPHEAPNGGVEAEAPPEGVTIPDEALAFLPVPEPPASAGVTSPRVARELRAVREARGLSLSDAANATRIWERYLQGLEANAPLEEFPAPAYARFFLRAYAEFLGIEPDAIVLEFDVDHPVREQPLLRTVPYVKPRRNRGIAGALIFLSILALAALAVVRYQQGRQEEVRIPAMQAEASGEASQPPATAKRPPAPPVDHVRAVLHVNVRSWVVVVGDGQTLQSGTVLEAGEHAAYRAHHHLEITLGNAGGVDLEVNGEAVDTGSSGSVVTLAFTVHDGEIHTKTL